MPHAFQDALLPPSGIRLNLISEVALSSDGAARPIHILRTGTFTGMSGIPVTFERADLAAIVANFSAGKRKRPPITERHDWGRAVGRMVGLYIDAAGENLYAVPKWGAEGRKLISDEVYDGFSVELDKEDAGYTLIGGSLTNYPAVDGLEAVTLQAPPLEEVPPPTSEAAPPPPPVDTPSQPTTEVQPMSDTPLEQAALLDLPPISDPALQNRLDAILAQQQAAMQQRERDIEARVQAEFDRRLLESEQRNAIRQFAHTRTMTTPNQPYAIPGTATELEQLLLETPAQVRGKWQALLTRICQSGAVSFDEIGSSGDGGESGDRWSILLNAKVAAGLSRVDAIRAVAKEHPDLYAAQRKGGR